MFPLRRFRVEDVKNLCQRLGFAYVRFEKWD